MLNHTEILELASRVPPPVGATYTVSSFTSWIFDLSHNHTPTLHRPFEFERKQGIELELGLLNQARREAELAITKNNGLEIVHRDDINNTGLYFDISKLLINNIPLRGRPDIVFREIKSGKIHIIEIKCSLKPPTLWPNLKAQLWCYGQIDKWGDAPSISLKAWIYNPKYETRVAKQIELGHPGDDHMNRECSELFGHFQRWLSRRGDSAFTPSHP